MRFSLWLLATALLPAASMAWVQEGYYRHPALHDDTVVFVSEGDLWRVSADGGRAQRLTTHPAAESRPVISADGTQIAFVASYDGAPDLYLMPIAGGEPKRLTFDGSQVWPAGFSPEGRVIYATEHVIGSGFGRSLRMVDPASGKNEAVPLADARQAAFDKDGQTLWFTRFGLAVSGDHVHGYRGGAMAQLWRWDIDGEHEARRLAADWNANLSHPMWWNNQLYVIADADGRNNLWRLDADGGNPEKLTAHEPFEVRDARIDNGRIIYRVGADVHIHDLAAGQGRKLDIKLGSDFLQRRERYLDDPLEWVNNASPNAGGERVALTVRGQAWLAGTESLRRIRLAVPDHARARAAVPVANGDHVFAIVDHDGKSEIWRFAADGSPATRVLVEDQRSYRQQLWPSPDGRWLAHSDKHDKLWLLDLDSGGNELLDSAEHGGGNSYGDLSWSPDGRYLAFSRPDSSRTLAQLVVAEASARKVQVLTSDRYASYSPAFSPDGQWLYFISDRHFAPVPGSPWGDRNTGALFDKRAGIYALALQPGLRFPFRPADELTPEDRPEEKEKEKEEKEDDGSDAAEARPDIVFDGLEDRLHEVGIAPGNYSALQAGSERLYFLSRQAGEDEAEIQSLAIGPGEDEAKTWMEDVAAMQLSPDGERLMVIKPGKDRRIEEILLLPAAEEAPSDTRDAKVALDNWSLRIDPVEEWQQMFADAWNMHRHFSFDPAMRGVDWEAVRERYRPLVARVNDRRELDDLLGQMIAELGILHSQVRGGDYRDDRDAPEPSSLGARLAAGENGVVIEHIYRSDPELPGSRGPLHRPGVDIQNGDLIVAINGTPVAGLAEVARELRGQAGQQVLLDLTRGENSRRHIVEPVTMGTDTRLRYRDWLHANINKVQQAGDGRIGYLHLYAMGSSDFASFVREFYAQYDRDALIIDVRRNRGGNIDSWIIEKLLRRAWAFWQGPNGPPHTNMQQAFRGHLVVLADNFTYSDGETFTAAVKSLGLGPVIGQRTAGAGIWLSDRNRLRDGGLARIAETGQFDMAGHWIIEGHGVAPDIKVENPPHASATGSDAQLEAALEYLEQKLAEEPVPPLEAGPIAPVGEPAADAMPLDSDPST